MSESQDPSVAANSSADSPKQPAKRRRRPSKGVSLFAAGEPMVWLSGGTLAFCAFMVVGLLLLVLNKGMQTFWPSAIVKVKTEDGQVFMGDVTRLNEYRPAESVIESLPPAIAAKAQAVVDSGEYATRRLFRTGNYRLTSTHFQWVDDFAVAQREEPEWALEVERLEWGVFYGFPEAFVKLTLLEDTSPEAIRQLASSMRSELPEGAELKLIDGQGPDQKLIDLDSLESASSPSALAEVHQGAEAAWAGYQAHHGEVRERWLQRRHLEKHDTGAVNAVQEKARLKVRELEMELARVVGGKDEAAARQALVKAQANLQDKREWADAEFARIRGEIDSIDLRNARYQLLLETAGEGTREPQQTFLQLDDIVRASPINRMSFGEAVALYLHRWYEFLTDDPREANSEGGVFPAIFGTVAMTLLMSIAVVPFGVLAALYLREYAKAGPLVSAVRIAVNNLAGVPSIVFGVFGLGFFCYTLGASLDEIFFAAQLPNPTYGKGGLMWASFTLALLTLPVVIVATEEAIAAVPSSMREGSYACGASKWQTIQRIVLPRAMPGIITGMILAIARGAGEVAPLMLVGAVKLAPELPIDGIWPFVHPERSFMHLGFHIYDVGFQSQNSEAAKPMVYTTTLLLITITATLNLAAVWLRNQLRKKFTGSQF